MAATADLPVIITPRAIDSLRPYLVADVADRLGEMTRQFIAGHVQPLYAPSREDFDATLLRAVPRAGRPRTDLVVTLLQAIDPTRGAQALRESFDTTQAALTREGWRLGDGLESLNVAVHELGELIRHPYPLTATAGAREVFESAMVRAVELDLCVLGPLVFLQGDLPGADPARVRRGCELAAINAAVLASRISVMSGTDVTGAERSTLLHDLAGSWSDSEEDERALQRTYEDRTRDR
ncbi:MAG: hypothetical protein K8T90_21650 [Planctomycetes bacterium]|nr:hypothetical protein [Planctomycetota bacterium]